MREKQEKKAAAAAEKAAKKWYCFFPLNIQAFMPNFFLTTYNGIQNSSLNFNM